MSNNNEYFISQDTAGLLYSVNGKEKAPGNEDSHYKGAIQPIDFIEDQELGFHEANIVKYISRWKKKGQMEDLYKVAWYLNRLIDFAKDKGIKVYVNKEEYDSLKK